ncbi:MAG: hypothetical protein ACT4QC_20800, partial [Planctomycetaceae bacterium]
PPAWPKNFRNMPLTGRSLGNSEPSLNACSASQSEEIAKSESAGTSNAAEVGVPIVAIHRTSPLGSPQLGRGKPLSPNTRRYAHGFWGRHITKEEFPEHSCNFWVSLMVGYGGNIVMLLPNGVVYYVFSDGMEFPWVDFVHETAKLSPFCH